MPLKPARLLFTVLTLSFAIYAQDAKSQLNEQLWEAARKGDAITVKALIEKGADVNAKFRYGATALSYASDKGHTEVVNVLLENGAEVNVKDTFYQATPISWAMQKGHVAIVAALLSKGAEGADQVLLSGARRGNKEMVSVALAKGTPKPETLTTALASAAMNNQDEIVEMLKKAGATPPPEVDAATLESYVGKYKNEQGTEVSITFKDGKLFATPTGQNPIALIAVDRTSFRPAEFDGILVTLNIENEKVTGFNLRQGPGTTVFKRVE